MIATTMTAQENIDLDGQALEDLRSACQNLRDYLLDGSGMPDAAKRATALDLVVELLGKHQHVTLTADLTTGFGTCFGTAQEEREQGGRTW